MEFHEKLLEEGGTVKFVTYYLFKTSLHYMYTQDIFIKFPTPMAYMMVFVTIRGLLLLMYTEVKSSGFIIDFHYENRIFKDDLCKNYTTIIHETLI